MNKLQLNARLRPPYYRSIFSILSAGKHTNNKIQEAWALCY